MMTTTVVARARDAGTRAVTRISSSAIAEAAFLVSVPIAGAPDVLRGVSEPSETCAVVAGLAQLGETHRSVVKQLIP